MKKSCILKSIMLAILLLFLIPMYNSIAATSDSDVLMTSSGITITKTTTVQQIKSKYGADPKLITPSAFGGNMYTWYRGDYEDLIYVETDSTGTIISCGTISDDFTSSLYSAGDKVITSGRVYLYSGIASYANSLTKKANGILIYQKDLLTTERVNAYKREYVSKRYYYDKSLAQQSTLMLNALLREKGSVNRAQFSSELFDKVKRVKETMTMTDYAEKNGKDQYYNDCGTDFGSSTLYEDLPNPLRPAASVSGQFPTEELKYVYLQYTIYQNEETGKYSGGLDSFYMSEKLFEKYVPLEMTTEEKTKYNNAREVYLKSIQEFNEGGTEVYETEPTYASLPLVAGKIKTNKLLGVTDYLNSVRVAAGLGKLTHNADASNAAQHKAVLTTYIANKGLVNANPHFPSKPTGVSDEFYNTAQSYMSGENLYGGNIITTIAHALHDGAGDAERGGHRYNLLKPTWAYLGYGYCNGQGVHKLSGYQASTVDFVAWPSIGVTPLEAWYDNCYWSFKEYGSNYSIQTNTTVEVKRLNDNKTWTFDSMSASNTNNVSRFYRGSDMVSFYNADLKGGDGLIYQITIKNIKNNKTNVIEDYTYRAVFKYLSGGINIVYPTQVTLNKTSIKGTKGSEERLEVTFSPNNSTEIATKWYSSNTSVATVNQYGIVKFIAPGTATITVETLNGKKAYCTVQCVSTISGLKFEKNSIILIEKESEQLKLVETSGMIIDKDNVKWTISDSTKATIDSTGTITAKAEGDIKIVASYGGKSATCTVKIIPKQKYRPTFKSVSGLGFYDMLSAGETSTVTITQTEKNYSIYLTKIEGDFKYDTENLEIVSIKPLLKGMTGKITESGTIHFSFDSGTELTKIVGDIAVVTVRAKETAVYAKNQFTFEDVKYKFYGNDTEYYGSAIYAATIKTANNIKSISLSKTSCELALVGNTTMLTATITPTEYVKDTSITWTTSNSAVATVTNKGLVTAKGEGTAIITAKTSNGKTATCKITVPKQKPPTIAITKVTVSPTTATMNIGTTQTIKATIEPTNTTQSKTITWSSNYTTVATVDSTGKVTAKSPGSAIITAKASNGKKATCTVVVLGVNAIPITKVTVSPTAVTIKKGETSTLKATITPSNTTQSKTITWTTSNSAVATVNSSGVVTAKGSGTATITAKTSNGRTATCKVTVPSTTTTTKPTTVAITKVTVSPTAVTIKKGATSTLKATITPSNTTQSKTITWTTSNSAVATVNSSGVVTAKGNGTATITAKTSNGKTATCKVTVPSTTTTTKPTTVAITKVTVSPTTVTIKKGATSTLKATITPSNTTQSKTITWTTSNSAVATVNSSGVVTAKGSGTATITAKTSNGKTATCKVTVPSTTTTTKPSTNTTTKAVPNVLYRTHVQNVSWQSYVKNGAMSGTSGKSLRLEGIKIKLENNEYGGGITYETHVQDIGWQGYVKDDAMAGTSGKSLRLEGIRIKLTGEISKYYDVYYRVHCQDFGWMDWAKNGESAGSAGYSYRLEGIEIRLVKKGGTAPGKTDLPFIQRLVRYQTHIQDVGWQEVVKDGKTSGTSGRSLRLEGIRIYLDNQQYDGSIQYSTHVQNLGWQNFVQNGAMSGTSGKSLRLEAIKIKLTGTMAKKYDVYYRVHCQNFGWMGWAKNGEAAGSAGYSYRLEAIQIVIVEKGEKAPTSTTKCYIEK